MKTTEAGLIVKHIIKSTGTTYEKFGDVFGFHKNTINAWVNGYQRPSYDDIVMIVDHYRLDISQLRVEVQNAN